MKIKEFAIWKYGPLSGTGKVEPGNFNLFFGPNEQGKTLTIDALVKLLLKKSYKEFEENINRVNELPEGYVILERGDGKTTKLPEAGDLTRATGLTASECRNIFIIRDSDLSISREGEFYKGVTNRLTGLRTEEIERIKTGIRELARLTPKGEFLDTSPQKLKSNLARAGRLVEQIRELKESLEAEGYDRFETELAQINTRIVNTEQDLKRYEEARRREIYQKGSSALKLLQEACREAASLQRFNREDLERWQMLQSKVEPLQTEERRIREELGSANRELQQARQQAGQLNIAVQQLERTAALFSEQVELMLKDYESLSQELARQETLGGNLCTPRAATFAAALLLISLAGAIIRPAWWLLPLIGGSLVLILIFSGIRLSLARKKGRLAALWQEIYSRAAGLGAVADHPGELLAWWGEFKNRLAAEGQRLTGANSKVALQENLVERFRDQLNKLADHITQVERDLQQLMQEAAASSLQEYRQKLELKLELENQVQQQKAVLESHFSIPGSLSLPEQVSIWKSSLEKLEPFAGLGVGLIYNEQEVSRLEQELGKLRRRQEELTGKWGIYRKQLQDIEQEINKILCDEVSLMYCQTLADLEAAGKNLKEWIGRQEDNRRWALAAIELFDQIAAEEELKVLELFGEQSPVSRYFSEITGGRYTEVLFDTDQRKIMVDPAGESALCADQLSGGAYDQLYFSIRLALGEKLLAGETGFFILDDPFIKADPDRLKILLNMLLQVADSGWQVLYFSAKGEVRDTLQGKLQSGRVKEFCLG